MRFQKHRLAKEYAQITRKLQARPINVSLEESSLSDGAGNSSVEQTDYNPKPAFIPKNEIPAEKTVIPLINGTN